MNSCRTVKLALGSGGYFGFAHIGVLKVLEREGIQVEAISGSSVGSIMATLYAKGLRADEMEKASLEFAETLFSYRSWATIVSNNISEAKMVKTVEELIWAKDFSELKIPTFICATDLIRFKTVWFSEGDLVTAVRASIAVPGVFPVLEKDGIVLADGGILEPLPVDVFKSSDVPVLAVNLYSYQNYVGWEMPKNRVRRPVAALMRTSDAMLWATAQRQKEFWFITIEPDLSCANDESLSVQERAAAMVKKGEEATVMMLPELEKMFLRTLPREEGE